jgi:hypothetical protein
MGEKNQAGPRESDQTSMHGSKLRWVNNKHDNKSEDEKQDFKTKWCIR